MTAFSSAHCCVDMPLQVLKQAADCNKMCSTTLNTSPGRPAGAIRDQLGAERPAA